MSYNLQEEQNNNTVTPVNEVFNTNTPVSTPENVQSTLPIAENSTTTQRATTLAAEYNTSIEQAYNSLENTILQTDANKYLNTLYSLEGNGTLNATSDNDYIMSAAVGTNILNPVTSTTTEVINTESTTEGTNTTGSVGVYDGETPVVTNESTDEGFKIYKPEDIPQTEDGIYDLSEIYKKAIDAVQETADEQLEIQKKNGELALEMLQYAANAGISSFEYDWGTLGKGTEYLSTGYSGYSGYYNRGWRRYYGSHWRNYRRWRNYGWRNYSYWGNGYSSYGDSDLYGMNDDAANALEAYIKDGTAGSEAWENLSGEQRDEILSYLEYDYPDAGTAYEVLANAIGRMNKENHELLSPTDYNKYGTGLPLETNEDGTPITNAQLNAEWNAKHRKDILNPETGIIETYYFDSEEEKNKFNETEDKRQLYSGNVTWLDDLKTYFKEESEPKTELMRTEDYWDGEMLAADSGHQQMKLVGRRAGITKDSLIRSGIAIANTITETGDIISGNKAKQYVKGSAAKAINEFDNKVLGGSLKRDIKTIANELPVQTGRGAKKLNSVTDLLNTGIDTGINLIGGLANGKSLGKAYESAKATASKNESNRATARTFEPAKKKVQKDTTTTESGKKTTSRAAMNKMTQARNKADSNKSSNSKKSNNNKSSNSKKSNNNKSSNSKKSNNKKSNSNKSNSVTKTAQKAAKKIKKAAKNKSSNNKKK